MINQGLQGTAVGAETVPAQTSIETLVSHARQNNDNLQAHLTDMRGFLARVCGDAPQVSSTAETPVEVTGQLGELSTALSNQSRLLTELREVVVAVEKLA